MSDRPKRAAATRASEKQQSAKAASSRPAKAQKKESGSAAPSNGKKSSSSAKKDSDKEVKKESKPASGTKAGSDVQKRIEKLLADDIFAIAYPPIDPGQGELDAPDDVPIKPKPNMPKDKKSKGEVRNYTSPDLSPFEQLLCAMLLSKPISHRLGLRAIQTILSEPYDMRTPKALRDDAGFEGRRAAMWEARTQHKEKTAAQLGEAVGDLRKLCGGSEDSDAHDDAVKKLAPVLEAANKHKGDVGKAAEAVRSTIAPAVKGLGPTGVDIFIRRVQGTPGFSDVLYPFMDDRTQKAAEELGLLGKGSAGDALDAAKKLADAMPSNRRKPADFVRLVDVLIGLDLEKQVDEVNKKLG